jgi:hypothetical protein
MAKKKRKKKKSVAKPSPERIIRQRARNLPIHECWINKDWNIDGLANITVARKHSNGNLTLGLYLIDLGCLGVKDAYYIFNQIPDQYQQTIDRASQNFELEKIGYELAHNIIYAGLEYAEEYGFKPHKDFEIARCILEEDTEDIGLIEIDCGGEDGKPRYVRSPNDTNARAAQIFAQLEKTAGPGNYHYIVGDLLADPEEYDEYDEWLDPLDEDLISDYDPENSKNMYNDDSDIENSKTFQFKIKINGISKPPVWRKVLVPSYYSFQSFHYVIQTAFGWSSSHLFQFSENGYSDPTVITEIFDNAGEFEGDQIDANEIKLDEIFKKEKQKFMYIYDFGDSWEHAISLEKIIPSISGYPECLSGRGQCPPDDSGGFSGYEELKATMKDKSQPEHEEYSEWLGLEEGESWDPEFFDLQQANLRLHILFT